MPWLFVSPSHQQSWYWLLINGSLFLTREDFDYLHHIKCWKMMINSLRPRDIYASVYYSSLVQLQEYINQNSYIFVQENPFQNVIWKMSILSQPQCVKMQLMMMKMPIYLFIYPKINSAHKKLRHNCMWYNAIIISILLEVLCKMLGGLHLTPN